MTLGFTNALIAGSIAAGTVAFGYAFWTFIKICEGDYFD